MQRFKFDPWFAGYGWEDIELGFRLQRDAGMKLFYESAAIAYHDHHMSRRDFEERMRNIGKSCHMIFEKYPELGTLPSVKKRFVFRAISSSFALFLAKMVSQDLFFYALSKKYFLEGVDAGYNK